MKKSDVVTLIDAEIENIQAILGEDDYLFISHLGGYNEIKERGWVDKVQSPDLIKAKNWLKDMLKTQFVNYRRIRAQKTENAWKMGILLGIDDSNEYKALRAEVKKLQKIFNTVSKPDLFTKIVLKNLKKKDKAEGKAEDKTNDKQNPKTKQSTAKKKPTKSQAQTDKVDTGGDTGTDEQDAG